MALKTSSVGYTAFLASLSALPPISIDMNLPAVPGIEASFGEPSGQGALTLSLFVAGFLISPLIGGPLADRFGRRPSLLGALSAFALASLVCAAAPSFLTLLLGRFLQGTAAGMGVVLPLAIVRDVFEGATARQRLSQVTAMIGVAPLIAPALGSLVLSVADWRAIYLAQGAWGAVMALVVGLLFAETLPRERRQPLHAARLVRNYATVLGTREFLGYALCFAFGFAALFAYVSGSPTLLLEDLGISKFWFSAIFALTSAGLIMGSLLSARLSRLEMPAGRLVAFCLAGTGLCIGAAFAAALAGWVRVATIIPCVFGMIFAFGLSAPSMNHAAIHPLPHMAGAASGVIRSLQMLMGAAASALLTALIGPFSSAVAMTGTMALSILLAIAAYLLLLHGRGPRLAEPISGASGAE
ncbi:MFS transporter, DHA1 family, bicyclomycin/chloramphenicol resistance protein [Tistlia consotensis]|uniref:Bcr/CflA family efflux transporter n=1 Tax=Tistlia consotensis USBA 355 TaxID=560819 RepID=A0A1Y6B996_9PROT|nr:multidrug effflux MFS transporter [Tistlia consotensis]SME88379.1 MFS transporter, DHA1 family, bicyclomycin/chloramphenicol resistance protein [Tistlia consotensis USBA 355]SNR24836.1 MFS transporter, DHA1 family, bicyclomycin/chloramphenicol resistance protein [Tistlia consotensis]